MAPNRGSNRAKEFQHLASTAVADFDPEEGSPDDRDEESSDFDDSDEAGDGREHYERVGQSKLRKPNASDLGPQYQGLQVSREALTDGEDQNDPSDRSSGDEERDDISGEDGSESEEDRMNRVARSGEISSSGLVNGTTASRTNGSSGEVLKEQLRQTLHSEAQRAVSASLSSANREDAEKGYAVKKQRLAFDSLLKARMKLQGALVATNTLVGYSCERLREERTDADKTVEAAEAAVVTFWNSLTSLREALLASEAGQKRKRNQISSDAPVEALWNHLQQQESERQAARESVLRKWSTKTQAPNVQPSQSRLNPNHRQTTVLDSIQQQMSDIDRLKKRARAPRSCAPLQLSQRVTEDEKIYDDADFYTTLLKDLLEQKGQESASASTIDLGYQMRRNAKTKRNVDTKTSKGRKLRYTVHEKLQNFMAPEDRHQWGERQTDELFRSLFGQRLGLGESEDESDADDGAEREEASLMLFRS